MFAPLMTAALLCAAVALAQHAVPDRNVYSGELQYCGPTASEDGFCRSRADDAHARLICIHETDKYVSYLRARGEHDAHVERHGSGDPDRRICVGALYWKAACEAGKHHAPVRRLLTDFCLL